MSTYVAMLRGIGPGDPNMTGAKFTWFFEDLGFTGIKVVLASGNIIFESPNADKEALAQQIESSLPQKLGFTRSVVLRSKQELEHLIAQDPFQGIEQDHNKSAYLLVTFFRHAQPVALKFPFAPPGKPYTLLGQIDDAVFGSVDMTTGKTPDYMSWLEKQFGKDITSRTPKTIRLILSRMDKA